MVRFYRVFTLIGLKYQLTTGEPLLILKGVIVDGLRENSPLGIFAGIIEMPLEEIARIVAG